MTPAKPLPPWPEKPKRAYPQPPETNYWRYRGYVGHVDAAHHLYKNDLVAAWEARCRLAVKILEEVNMGRYFDEDGILRELESVGAIVDHVCERGLIPIDELPPLPEGTGE